MPRILSRHELFPRSKNRWYNLSSGGGSGSSWNSPTMSKFATDDSERNEKSSTRHNGISYRIDGVEIPKRAVASSSAVPDARDCEDDWGHYVDFSSPPQVLERRKSMLPSVATGATEDKPLNVLDISVMGWPLKQRC